MYMDSNNNVGGWDCDECKKTNIKTHYYRERYLCYHCRQKFLTIIGQPLIYEQQLSTKKIFLLLLTESQNKKLEQRIYSLFGKKRKVSAYMRELVLADLENNANDKQNTNIDKGDTP